MFLVPDEELVNFVVKPPPPFPASLIQTLAP